MEDMRYIQLDPTTVVAPSHLLVLWSRLGNFSESDLDKLMWREKQLLENWGHHASIVLTKDYPLFLARSRRFATGDGLWPRRVREGMSANKDLRRRVLSEVRRRGPLSSRELEGDSKARWKSARNRWGLKESAWSSGRDVARMLEFLYHMGAVAVAKRDGRQKVWDLSERFLPMGTPKDKLTEDEVEHKGAQLSLKGLGVATPKQISRHFLVNRYPNMKKTLASLQAEGKITPVAVDGPHAKGIWYIHTDDMTLAEEIARGGFEPRTTLLSPFDNLIADRDRTNQMFGFSYRIEIYTPKDKRKHGFFVLPILDGDRLIGRIDPVTDRQKEVFRINAVHAEHGAPRGRDPARRIADAVEDLASFLGAKRVVYPERIPEAWKGYLR